MQTFLEDWPADFSQELINRDENLISDRPETSRAVYENWAMDMGDGGTLLYTLGQNYGGNAWRPTKSFAKYRPRQRPRQPNRGGRPRCMRGIK